jgi:hypothetical protein
LKVYINSLFIVGTMIMLMISYKTITIK